MHTIFKSCTIPIACPSTLNKKRPLNDMAFNTGSGSFQFQKKLTLLLYIQWVSSFYDSEWLNEEHIDQVQALLHQQYADTDGLQAVCVQGSRLSTSMTNCWSIRADFKCCRQSLGHCHEHYHHHPITKCNSLIPCPSSLQITPCPFSCGNWLLFLSLKEYLRSGGLTKRSRWVEMSILCAIASAVHLCDGWLPELCDWDQAAIECPPEEIFSGGLHSNLSSESQSWLSLT